MKKDCNEPPEIMDPLGQALKDARLAVPLSIDEVAEKLNLSGTAVRDIEDNLVQILETKKYPIIYLRGYLANYAKLVGLSTLELFVEYQQLATVQKNNKVLPHSKLIMPHPKKRSKLLPFSLFVVAVAGIGFYLTQKPAPSITEQPLTELPEAKEISALSETVIVPSTTSSTLTLELKKQPVAIEVDEQPEVLAPQPVAITTAAVEKEIEPPVVVTEVEAVVVADPVITAPVITKEVAKESVEKIVVEKVDVGTKTDSLLLSFSAECWTEVFDATGKRVAYGLYKEGRVLKLLGVAPFQLKLGDPSVVAIEYQDQVIDGGFTPGRTARFNVPLS